MKALAVKNGQIITEYDLASSVKWCTPSVLGCKACISISAESGKSVIITITLETPVGNYSKSFTINNNVCFTFQPISVASIEVCISNFKVDSNEICLTFGCFFRWGTHVYRRPK